MRVSQTGAERLGGDTVGRSNRQALECQGSVVDGHHLAKTYEFPNFVDALAFVNAVGAIAEQEGHHPDLHLSWGKVSVEIWTHKIDGLTESDFVLAAKAERAFAQ